MRWPERPTCHGDDWKRFRQRWAWRSHLPDERYPQGEPFRTCSYCGSIHPEDLLKALDSGATLGGSDWKYGFPHKLYLYNIPNPHRDELAEIGQRSGPNEEGEIIYESIMGPQGDFNSKWYTIHLQDTGYDEEALQALLSRLTEASGIEWGVTDGKAWYKAPHFGYQR